jgi:hypothetical protein
MGLSSSSVTRCDALSQLLRRQRIAFSVRSEMNTTGMRWCPRWGRGLCLALIVLSASMSACALSCVAPDAIIERTPQTAEPTFPKAEVVIYGKMVELLPDEMAKAGLKRTVEGSSLARGV